MGRTKRGGHLGKVGLAIMVAGLAMMYYDGTTLPAGSGYQYHEHPAIHVPAALAVVAFSGAGIFIYNFSRGRNVV